MSPRDHTATLTHDLIIIPAAVARRPEVVSRAGSVYDRWAKPVIDRVGAALLGLLLLPLLVLISLAVLVTLGRPVFYVQSRVGRGGEAFGMLKFRTMRPDRRQRSEVATHQLDRRRRHKSDEDPRHTRLGRMLRCTSLDELPQLWNVLKGDMSLVGPRPELPSIVAHYDEWQHQRHQVKPGITGLWQVTERGRTAGEMHLHTETDLAYVSAVSLIQDLRILLQTPRSLTQGR